MGDVILTSAIVALNIALQTAPPRQITGATSRPSAKSSPSHSDHADGVTAYDLLSVVPADAALVLVVHRLTDFDRAMVSTGLPITWPANPSTLLQESLEMVAGLDTQGAAGVVLLSSPATAISAGQMVLLFPFSNRDALMTFWNPRVIDDGYFRVTLRGHESFLTTKGGFAIIGPSLSTVRAVADAPLPWTARLSNYQREQMNINQVSLWLNSAAAAPHALGPVATPWIWHGFGLTESTKKSCKLAQWSGRVTTKGITLTLYQEPAGPTTPPHRAQSDGLSIPGLPSESYVAVMGMRNFAKGKTTTHAIDLAVSTLRTAGVLDGPSTAELSRRLRSLLGRWDTVSAGVSPAPDDSGGTLRVWKVARTRGQVRYFRRDLKSVVSLLRRGVFVSDRLNQLLARLVLRRSAETVQDVSVDHLTLDLPSDAGTEIEMLKKLFGTEGFLVRIGVVDTHTLVVTLGGGDVYFGKVVEAVRARHSAKPDGPEAVPMWHDPGGAPLAEGYISLSQAMKLGGSLARMFGFPFPVGNPASAPSPISFSVGSVETGGTEVEVFVPGEAVLAIWKAVEGGARVH